MVNLNPCWLHPRVRVLAPLMVGFLWLCAQAAIRTNTPVPITDSVMIDNFDDQHIDYAGSYNGKVPTVQWPNCCGYHLCPWGNCSAGNQPVLDSTHRFDGKYSLKETYGSSSQDQAKMFNPHLNLSKYNGYRFWLWGNKTGKCFKLDIATGGGSHHYLQSFNMTDTVPVIVNFPVDPSIYTDIMEIVWWSNDCIGGSGM